MTIDCYGITQDLKTKNYIIVLDFMCTKCNRICNAIHFQQDFENWTSGNKYIDKSIQGTQLSSHDNHNDASNVLEWIPYNRFYDIKCIEEEEFRAKWIDGCIIEWN